MSRSVSLDGKTPPRIRVGKVSLFRRGPADPEILYSVSGVRVYLLFQRFLLRGIRHPSE